MAICGDNYKKRKGRLGKIKVTLMTLVKVTF